MKVNERDTEVIRRPKVIDDGMRYFGAIDLNDNLARLFKHGTVMEDPTLVDSRLHYRSRYLFYRCVFRI